MKPLIPWMPRVLVGLAATIVFLAAPLTAQEPGPDGEAESRPPRLLNSSEVSAALQANYPPVLLERRISGEPVLRFEVDSTGAVRNAEVEWAGGHSRFGEAALSVLEETRFAPALQSGRPVAATVRMPFTFVVDVPSDWWRWPDRSVQQPSLTNADVIRQKIEEWTPQILRSRNEDVRIMLDLIVDAEGSVWNVKVTRQTEYPALEQLALVLSSFMEFEPARGEDGMPVPARVMVPVTVRLRGW